MSAQVMRYTVIVRHPETDQPTALLVGKPVPKWATDLVHADDLEAPGKGASEVEESDDEDDAEKPAAKSSAKK